MTQTLRFLLPVAGRARRDRRRRSVVRIVSLVATLCAARAGYAADGWTVKTSDFREKNVALLSSIKDGKVRGTHQDSQFTDFPLSDVVEVTRDASVGAVSGFVLWTIDGGRFVGRQSGLEGSKIRWDVDQIGPVEVPLDRVLGVLRGPLDDAPLRAPVAEDEILLKNGDTVRGTITAVDDKGFTITPAAGDPVVLSGDVIVRVIFAPPAQGRPARQAAGFTVRLVNGVVLPCADVQLGGASEVSGQILRVSPAGGGGERNVSLESVVAIEHTGGRVRWLTDRTPLEAVATAFFGPAHQHRIGRNVTGGLIRAGGATYERGIGVHSHSRITYAIEPADRSFRTQYAVDNELPYADVDVRVLVDGKTVHEQKSLRSGILSPVIQADLRGAKTLTLEVDFGNNYDVQDRLNWIEPAIVRE